MIRYHLDIHPEYSEQQINFRDSIIMMGSCFSEHIASRLSDLRFELVPQAQGIVFNPVSLSKPFELMQKQQGYTVNDLVAYDGLWHGKFHHGAFSGHDQEQVLASVNAAHTTLETAVKTARFLFVTFGSAWVYEWKDTGEIVANCHKIPQINFEKKLLELDDIVAHWEQAILYLRTVNPALHIVFTVSPVKHLKDGVTENNLSKSVLFLAIRRLRQLYPALAYFPAYELVNDDLRDYRFYEADAAHPTAEAVNYVFDKFTASYMDRETIAYMTDMEKFRSLKAHRTQRTEGLEYEKYVERLDKLKKEIWQKYQVNPA